MPRKKQTGGRCVGGKFNSTGTATQQSDNLALVTRLLGEIGVDGYPLVEDKDRPFIDDCRFKLRGAGGAHTKMFGWKQVEAMVRIHKYVQEARLAFAQ